MPPPSAVARGINSSGGLRRNPKTPPLCAARRWFQSRATFICRAHSTATLVVEGEQMCVASKARGKCLPSPWKVAWSSSGHVLPWRLKGRWGIKLRGIWSPVLCCGELSGGWDGGRESGAELQHCSSTTTRETSVVAQHGIGCWTATVLQQGKWQQVTRHGCASFMIAAETATAGGHGKEHSWGYRQLELGVSSKIAGWGDNVQLGIISRLVVFFLIVLLKCSSFATRRENGSSTVHEIWIVWV